MTRTKHAAAEVAAQDGETRHDEADPGTAPGDLTAATSELMSQASEGREYAEQRRTSAAALMAAARTEAASIIGIAEAKARELGGQADHREREAHDLEGRARLLDQATGLRSRAEAAERQAEALTAERARLEADLAELDALSEQYGAERARLVSEYTTARASGDREAMTASRIGIEDADGLIADTTARRAGPASRIERVGGSDGPGELADVLTRGRGLRVQLWLALDALLQDGEQLSRPAVLQARDEETERHARTFAAERAVLAALADELGQVLPQLAEEAAELDRRDAVPAAMRTMDSALSLRYRIEAVKRFTASVSGALTAARTCLDQLAAAGPADLVNVLAASRVARLQIRRLLDTEREPLAEDDLSHPLEVLRDVTQSMIEAAQQPDPRPQHRVITPLH